MERCCIAIDLKSFYASVECVERGLDPLTAHLVVADRSRTEKTICLAVSPALKAYGISGRARLFEVVQRVGEVNRQRLRASGLAAPTGSSCDARALVADPTLAVDYLVAVPQMSHYLQRSADIYEVYLRYIAPEDIHVYSIDEVFIEATSYLRTYGLTPQELASLLVREVYQATGITATAGIGTNLYLAKVAMDILAKHEEPDEHGVRVAVLDEGSYRRRLWAHEPITDFWRVGPGTARRLESLGLHTMGDVARCSLGGAYGGRGQEALYELLGVNAELLIDHAWGLEPATMADVKGYRPAAHSIVAGQVLMAPYTTADARLVLWEMADGLAMDLRSRRQRTGKLVLTVGYDRTAAEGPEEAPPLPGQRPGALEAAGDAAAPSLKATVIDRYGRTLPKPAHGTRNLPFATDSSHWITEAACRLYDEIVDRSLPVRRLSLAAEAVVDGETAEGRGLGQMSLIADEDLAVGEEGAEREALEREHSVQDAMLDIRAKFGKNAILRMANLQEGATARERHNQIGGHRA